LWNECYKFKLSSSNPLVIKCCLTRIIVSHQRISKRTNVPPRFGDAADHKPRRTKFSLLNFLWMSHEFRPTDYLKRGSFFGLRTNRFGLESWTISIHSCCWYEVSKVKMFSKLAPLQQNSIFMLKFCLNFPLSRVQQVDLMCP
jgi:hypothetical protein